MLFGCFPWLVSKNLFGVFFPSLEWKLTKTWFCSSLQPLLAFSRYDLVFPSLLLSKLIPSPGFQLEHEKPDLESKIRDFFKTKRTTAPVPSQVILNSRVTFYSLNNHKLNNKNENVKKHSGSKNDFAFLCFALQLRLHRITLSRRIS